MTILTYLLQINTPSSHHNSSFLHTLLSLYMLRGFSVMHTCGVEVSTSALKLEIISKKDNSEKIEGDQLNMS